MDRSWWRVLTKLGLLEKGMANHFSILFLRTLWKAWNDKKCHLGSPNNFEQIKSRMFTQQPYFPESTEFQKDQKTPAVSRNVTGEMLGGASALRASPFSVCTGWRQAHSPVILALPASLCLPSLYPETAGFSWMGKPSWRPTSCTQALPELRCGYSASGYPLYKSRESYMLIPTS